MKPSESVSVPPVEKAWRKVTYSLPAKVADELDRRTEGRGKIKSRMVSEALAHYFEAQDRESLAALYEQAARDPKFVADNRAVEEDFAALDDEAGGGEP
jgi:hypothetical protein